MSLEYLCPGPVSRLQGPVCAPFGHGIIELAASLFATGKHTLFEAF